MPVTRWLMSRQRLALAQGQDVNRNTWAGWPVALAPSAQEEHDFQNPMCLMIRRRTSYVVFCVCGRAAIPEALPHNRSIQPQQHKFG
jgi:hypothetical protein